MNRDTEVRILRHVPSVLILLGVMVLISIFGYYDLLIVRHVQAGGGLRTLWTWIHEVFIQTDFINLRLTLLAWWAVFAIVTGVVLHRRVRQWDTPERETS